MTIATPERKPGPHTIPVWLLLLVVALLFATAALAEYALRTNAQRRVDDPVEAAIVAGETAVARDPGDLESRLRLGYAYQEAGRYEDALEQYAAVLDADPASTAARYNTGVVLLQLQRYEEAEAALRAVVAQSPGHVLAAKALGQRYVDTRRYAEALAVLAPAVQASPQFADVQYLAGLAAENLGQRDEAIAYYRGALRYVPDLREAREGLARLGADAEEVGE